MLSMAARNSSRLSAFLITSGVAAIISMPRRSRMPVSATIRAVLSAVWPPRVGRMASGRSARSTSMTTSGVMGST